MTVETIQAPPSCGLTEEEALQSRKLHGKNCFTKQRETPFWRIFLSNLNDPVIRILLGALAVNLLLLGRGGNAVETAGIGIAVFCAALISSVSEFSSRRAFSRLSEMGNAPVRVLRGGEVREIPISDVAVGDRVLLSAGEGIPADGILLSGALSASSPAKSACRGILPPSPFFSCRFSIPFFSTAG